MADISKIKTLDGTTYNLKDATARSSIPAAATTAPVMDGTAAVGSSTKYAREDHVHPSDDSKYGVGSTLFTTNSFLPDKYKKFYYSKIDNALYIADQRYNVSMTINGVNNTYIKPLFDGSYEGGVNIPDGQTGVITFDFSNLTGSKFPGYPYGTIYISFYSSRTPKSITARLYNNYENQGTGWKNIEFAKVDTNGYLWSIQNTYYGLQTLEITITAKDISTYGETRPVEIEMWLDRPDPLKNPYVSKYGSETLYFPLTAPNFIGKINNHTVNSDVPANAIFTDTTYESKTAASGGTDVSLVTTGEKYTWNNKGSGTITGITMNGTSKGTSGVVDLGTVITAHQDITGKLDVAQGAANAGKFLVVGSDGNITAVTMTAWQGGSY